MYAYREVIILDDPQKLVLSKPLPLASGQSVEVLVVADDIPSVPARNRNTWAAFLAKRDRLLDEHPDEIKKFMSEQPQADKQYLRDPFEDWEE